MTAVRIYLDTSAVLKRVFRETESQDLLDTVEMHWSAGDGLVTSSLAQVETNRALLTRLGATSEFNPRLADDALAGIVEYPMTPEVVSAARRLRPVSLRTLDAIHLASAIMLGADLVVAYDHRLVEACAHNLIPTASPGLN